MSRLARTIAFVVVAVVVVAVLFLYVFPWVDTIVNNPTMGAAAAPAA